MKDLVKEKVVNEASMPIIRPMSFIGILGLIGMMTSPVVWIWGGFDYAWKTAATSFFVLIAVHLLSLLVRSVFRDTYDREVEIASKEEAIKDYKCNSKKSSFQRHLEEAVKRKYGGK